MNYLRVPVCEQVKTGVANAVRAFLKSNILQRRWYGGGVGAGKGNRFYYSTFIYIAPFIQSSLSILKFISILWIKYIVLDISIIMKIIWIFHEISLLREPFSLINLLYSLLYLIRRKALKTQFCIFLY